MDVVDAGARRFCGEKVIHGVSLLLEASVILTKVPLGRLMIQRVGFGMGKIACGASTKSILRTIMMSDRLYIDFIAILQ